MATAYDDVSLFQTIDKLLRQQEEAAGADRRDAWRHSFRCTQLLAPYDRKRLPQPADFRQVRCHDLSPGGFSFYSYRRPATEQVVVALGQVPFLFVVAEIRHVRPRVGENEHGFLVGCRFVEKLT